MLAAGYVIYNDLKNIDVRYSIFNCDFFLIENKTMTSSFSYHYCA